MTKRPPGTANRVLRVCRLLNRHRVRYLLVGGVAANLHGSVRATRDVDLLIPKDPANTERLLAALGELPYGIAREFAPEEILRKPVTIIGDDPRVDILTVAWTVSFEQANRTRKVRTVEGVRIPFLALDLLIRSKRTGRSQDLADIESLKRLRRASPRSRRSSRTSRPRAPRASG